MCCEKEQTFSSFQARIDLVKMKKPSKKKSMMSSWEGLYLFLGYVDEQISMGQDDGIRKCIIKGKDEQQWEHPMKDL
jgi:hypothetical protein